MASINKQVYDTIDGLGTSPIPSGILGAGLVLKGLANDQVTTKTGDLKKVVSRVKPTKATCLTFGAANLLGTWMMIDGDPVNAAGFNFAWSALYTIVNGKASLTGLLRGRVGAAALGTLALGNTTIYGLKFFWPGHHITPA